MPVPVEYQQATRALGLSVGLIALYLGARQWFERKARDESSSSGDARYFRRQDRRRWLGVGVMLTLAAEIYFSSSVAPRVGGRGNPRFIAVWLFVLSLIVVMLLLALVDWMATHTYAQRQRKALFREQIDELRRRGRTKSGGPSDDG